MRRAGRWRGMQKCLAHVRYYRILRQHHGVELWLDTRLESHASTNGKRSNRCVSDKSNFYGVVMSWQRAELKSSLSSFFASSSVSSSRFRQLRLSVPEAASLQLDDLTSTASQSHPINAFLVPSRSSVPEVYFQPPKYMR